MRHFYDTQAATYEFTRRWLLWGRKRIIRELNLQAGEAVLEVGCGTGWNLPELSMAVGSTGRVIGLEISSGMAERAKARKLPTNTKILLGDASKGIAAERPVDAVLFSYSLSAIPKWEDALENSFALLGKTGRIGIVDFCPNIHVPKSINDLFLEHGRRHSCDFKVAPETWLRRHDLKVGRSLQHLGFSYRIVARRISPGA